MTTPESSRLIAETLRLDEIPRPGEWQHGEAGSANLVSFDGDDISPVATVVCEENIDVIVHNRTSAPRLARMLKAALAALEPIDRNTSVNPRGDAGDALAEIERIAKGEQ